MAMHDSHFGTIDDQYWRQAAPRARMMAAKIYGWQPPGWTFLLALGAALPAVLGILFSPAMISLAPAVETIAPVAEARAVAAGNARLAELSSPFNAIMLMVADVFADAPGRVLLVQKAIGALLVAGLFAYFASTRLPAVQAGAVSAAIAFYVAAPLAGPTEFGMALLLVCAFSFLAASADPADLRARIEGALAGLGVASLWLLNPFFALAGFLTLAACPFMSGYAGLTRYGFAFGGFALLALIAELIAPGVNGARAAASSEIVAGINSLPGLPYTKDNAATIAGVSVVLLAVAIFGGREHIRSWAPALGLVALAVIASHMMGVDPLAALVLSGAIACFSVASPFYDGIFKSHDRASVSIALSAAALIMSWAGYQVAQSLQQFGVQGAAIKDAQEMDVIDFGVVQADPVDYGMEPQSNPFGYAALSIAQQSAMLLEAADLLQDAKGRGEAAALLTYADIACLLVENRECRANGADATKASTIIFVPRRSLGAATADLKARSEVLLYTEFKLVSQTPLWETWVRRNETAIAGLQH